MRGHNDPAKGSEAWNEAATLCHTALSVLLRAFGHSKQGLQMSVGFEHSSHCILCLIQMRRHGLSSPEGIPAFDFLEDVAMMIPSFGEGLRILKGHAADRE